MSLYLDSYSAAGCVSGEQNRSHAVVNHFKQVIRDGVSLTKYATNNELQGFNLYLKPNRH